MNVVLAIPVLPSIPTLVVELLIFLAMVWFMERFVFTPIREAWSERNRRIQEGLAASNESRTELEQARAEVARILSEARSQAQAEIDAAVARAGRVRDQLVERATEEFRRLVDAAQADIERERETAATTLQTRVVDLALLAASRVTGQAYTAPAVREIAAAVVSRESLG
jgi:F-type H+-transporting ATPase subunit b